MGFNSKYTGLLPIGLGVYAIVKREIGLGPSVGLQTQFLVTGFPAVLLGIAMVGIGALILLITD